ncbi:MAG: Lrp/AsnC ligand binding domain-containing protein [Solirubrobacteraceae bacterium]|nr:Lrp/AsnC ligand binding domain-containing protein [Solirubrobacteraceae bacterium]
MTHAIVMVEAERDAMSGLGADLAQVPGVRECYSVTGEWDFVCIVSTPRHEELKSIVTGGLSGVAGVVRTQTMVAFEVYSKHDLDGMFDIGNE